MPVAARVSISLHWICRKLTRSLKFSITHVPRERNAEANGLAQFRRPRATFFKGSSILALPGAL